MSLQWTLVAGVMYIELGVTIILLMPFISPQRWSSIFKSRFLRSIGSMGHIYFKIFLGILVLFFIDAIREMRKYGKELDSQEHEHAHHLDADMQAHMRLFRAQRNFYISGFSLFLWVVLQRLATLITRLAVALAQKEAAMKQAESASKTASSLLRGDEKTKLKSEGQEEGVEKEKLLKELKDENRRLDAEYKAALKQATSVTDEYDRLLKEHSKLQDELKKCKNEEGSKKGD